MIQRPVAVGLIVCEHLIVEEGTRNVTLVNCTPGLTASSFPAVAQRLTVYAALTDGLGDGTLRLSVGHLDTMEEIYVRDQPIHFPDPLQERRIYFRLRQLRFPAPGRYQFTLLADGEWVAQQVIRVAVKER